MASKLTLGPLALALALTHSLPGWAQQKLGRLEPKITLKGQAAGDQCSLSMTSLQDGSLHTELELAQGDYSAKVECKLNGKTLLVLVPKLRIRAGKTTTQRIAVQPVGLRVETRRNGIMLPANVRILAPGQKEALYEIPANQRKVIAAGLYDIIVELRETGGPRAEAIFANSRLRPGKTKVLKADLSDGSLVVEAFANGRKASGSIRVFAPGSTKDMGLVEVGQEMRLPAGRYMVSTELRETADFASKKREVWIRAGRLQKIKEQFNLGTLSVTVIKDKKPVDATVRLSVSGAADFFNYFSAPGTVSLSPGTYDVTINSKAAGPLKNLKTKNIEVKRGRKTNKTFDLTPAILTVEVLKNWERTTAQLLVRFAGGGDKIEPELDGSYRLWPGRYEIEARLEDGKKTLDGPFEVTLGKNINRKINFKRAVLTVRAMRGKQLDTKAEVYIFMPGATKPTARGRSGARIEVQPGVYDIKVIGDVDTVWKQKVKIRKVQSVEIALPERAADEPLPEGDLPPPKDGLPEGDPGEPGDP